MRCPNCQNLKTEYSGTSHNTHGSQIDISETFTIMHCPECQLIFPALKMASNYYQKYYSHNYYHHRARTVFDSIFTNFVYWWQRNYLLDFSSVHTILDFGCGEGIFLHSLPPTLIKYGIEINSEARAQAKRYCPQAEFYKDTTQIASKVRFDLITLWHVLEHLEEPLRKLVNLQKLLRKNGQLIIATPNTNSWGYKLTNNHWFHLDCPRHLQLFNFQNIKQLCCQAGFKVEIVAPVMLEYPLDIFWSIKHKLTTRYFLINILILPVIILTTLILKISVLFFPSKTEIMIIKCRKH